MVSGCLDIYADNVTLRNVIINCGGNYPLDIKGANVVVEYSKINCTSGSKIFKMKNPVNGRVQKNELKGCEDFFFIGGDVEGLVISDNYAHSVYGGPGAHSDGFQIGEFEPTYGSMSIQGNYFHKNNEEIGATDIVFATNYSTVTLIFENNYVTPWGAYTLRCRPDAYCVARNNVYSLDFLDFGNGLNPQGFDEFYCNRLENGELLDSNYGEAGACPDFNSGQ